MKLRTHQPFNLHLAYPSVLNVVQNVPVGEPRRDHAEERRKALTVNADKRENKGMAELTPQQRFLAQSLGVTPNQSPLHGIHM